MKKLYKLSIAVALLFGATSANAQNPDVYVGGIKNNQAAIWKNEDPTVIANGDDVSAMVVIGDDVYAAGKSQGGGSVWKNNEVLFTLSEFDFYDRFVTSMAIHGDDVYVTTNEMSSSDWSFIGRLWINGVASDDYADAAELSGICFDGDDIYVAGRTNEEAVIWKNGEPLYTYTSSVTGMFTDVKVVDGDVYYIGGDFGGNGKCTAIKDRECLNVNHENNRDLSINIWKNGEVLYTLANEAYGLTLAVSNGTVYASGQVPNSSIFKAIVWVNGEGTIISDEWSGAQGMCVHNDNVYVTGFAGNLPELDTFIWKDGVLTTFTSDGYDMGYCIEVVDGSTGIEQIDNYSAIYPNPADSFITIEGVRFEEAVIYNSSGQVVVTSRNNTIDVSSLESGVYLLKVDNNLTRNIVIRH
ncbi:MAG: T9SS type A sorting domain-containing protein [Bacteroidales bacterium]|nr:T9SS type A sorting domain-containing protein [Bacteroidales bacterium]